MKLLRPLLFLCAVCVCVVAQSQERPAPASAAPAGDAANVAGTVVNSLTGKPLADVHIRLVAFGQDGMPSILYGAMSGASGRFAFAGVPPGTYIILPERAGFVGIASGKKGAAASGPLELRPGAQLTDLTLEMSPRAIVSGTVRDEYGDPAMGVQITPIPLTQQMILNGFPGSVVTDDRGYFRLALPPGKYYIKATSGTHEGGVPEIRTDGTAEGVYAEIYYPGVTEKSSATPMEAKPGAEVNGVEIRLTRTPVLSISGEVFGIPDGVATMQLTLRSGPDRSHITSSSSQGNSVAGGAKLDGKFQFGHLGPGYYAIFANCKGGDQEMRTQIAEVTLRDSSVENLNLTLAPGKYRLFAISRLSAFREREDMIEHNRRKAESVEIKEGDRIVKNLKLSGEEENETPK